MGNILLTEQFRVGIKDFLQTKSSKKTLKIKYKERQGIILSIEAPQIIEEDIQVQNKLEITPLSQLDQLMNMGATFKIWIRCQIYLDPSERKRYYKKCRICSTKIAQHRLLQKCEKCEQETSHVVGYSLIFWLIDGELKTKAIMFEAAEQFLGLSALQFKQLDFDRQNNLLNRINQEKGAINFILQVGVGKKLPIVYIIQQIF